MGIFDDGFVDDNALSKENKDIEKNANVVYLKGDTTYTESTEDVYEVTEVEQRVGTLNKNAYYVVNENNSISSVDVNKITNTNAKVTTNVDMVGDKSQQVIFLDNERMSYDDMKAYWGESIRNYLTDTAGTFGSSLSLVGNSIVSGYAAGLGDRMADKLTGKLEKFIRDKWGYKGDLKFYARFKNLDAKRDSGKEFIYEFSNTTRITFSYDKLGKDQGIEYGVGETPMRVKIIRPITGYFGLYSLLRISNTETNPNYINQPISMEDFESASSDAGVGNVAESGMGGSVMQIYVTNKDNSKFGNDNVKITYNFKKIWLQSYHLSPNVNSEGGYALDEVLELTGVMEQPKIEGYAFATDNYLTIRNDNKLRRDI